MNPRKTISACCVGALGSCWLSAAPISWSPAVATSGKTNLIEGNVVIALTGGSSSRSITNGGASGTSTYNFISANFTTLSPHVFTATAGGPNPRARVADNVYGGSSISSTGDSDFDTVIASVTDSYGSPSGITGGTLTLDGLLDGGSYTIQVFFNDQREASDDRVMRFGDGIGTPVDLAGGNPAAGVQTSEYGQHAIGTFSASGTSQDLTLTALGFGNVHFNAILVTGPPGVLPNQAPVFDESSYEFEVLNESAPSAVVGTVSATDPDTGPSAIEYSITAGDPGGAFDIDSVTGEITVAGTIDYTVTSYYPLDVTASDGQDATVVYVDVYVVGPPANVAAAGSASGNGSWNNSGYGSFGYLFVGTDDDDIEAGTYKRGGAIYTGIETPVSGQTVRFEKLSSSLSAWNTNQPTSPINPAITAELENPDGGTFRCGSLYNTGLADNTPRNIFRLTFDEAVPDGLRLAICVGASEIQGTAATIDSTTGNLRDVPFSVAVDGMESFTTQAALAGPPAPEWLTVSPDDPNTGVPVPDWYFFDLTGIEAGTRVTISASRIWSDASHKFNPINGFALASLAAPPAVITGVSRTANSFIINFLGDPGVTDWKIMASTDLLSFLIDETPDTVFNESPAGVYSATVDVTGDPASYFMRIER
ncbi:hypothetical protein HAHE_04750 [Haloferula helveola]|uniref:Cadherin domain-containing protein n=1 Tax=Haloferula helveola TaxID=490095 RepID=A0ABM7R783_9BACT|nr:hypothetical protein HAHE_04750 [Haloferula helveola]